VAAIHFGNSSSTLDEGILSHVEFMTLESPPATTVAPAVALGAALAAPTGARLRDVARSAKSAVILVPGVDRIARVDSIVPVLLAELEEGGVSRERVTVFLATGTHVHEGQRDMERLLGPILARSLRCIIHDPRDRERLVPIGTTSRLTPVEIAREVLDADIRILTARVVPHYFAGFGGGRKALVPGAAGLKTILANHRLTLAPDRGIAPGVAPCSLDQNPVHLDMLEAASMVVGPTFTVNMVLDTRHDVVAAFAGDLENCHAEACAAAVRLHQVHAPEAFDAVISSAGGAPYDCSFVQTLKAIFNVDKALRPGGTMLIVGECRQGIAPAFLEWAKVASDAELDERVRDQYDLGGHNTIMLRSVLRRARVGLVSKLDPAVVRRMNLQPFDTVDAGVRWLSEEVPRRGRVAFVPYANVTHATCA